MAEVKDMRMKLEIDLLKRISSRGIGVAVVPRRASNSFSTSHERVKPAVAAKAIPTQRSAGAMLDVSIEGSRVTTKMASSRREYVKVAIRISRLRSSTLRSLRIKSQQMLSLAFI